MKKIAVRGAIILAILVACSMFFAQTIVTITTPKIKLEEARQGKFEDKMSLSGKLYFEKTENVTPEGLESGSSIQIDKLKVKAGDFVTAGTLIATAKISDSYDKTVDEAREALSKAYADYRDNEIAYIRLTPNTDSDKNSAYRRAADAEKELQDAQIDLLTAAAQAGVVLPADTSKWAELIQRSGDPTLIEKMEGVIDKKLALNKANDAFIETYSESRTKKELYEFIQKRESLQKAIDEAEEKLIDLVAKSEALRSIRAPHDGYITEMNIAEGEAYDGSKAAYAMSVNCEPVLRVDVSSSKREFTEGMRADIKSEFDDIKSSVTAVTREGTSEKYLHVALEPGTVTKLGGLRSLMNQELGVKVTYKAKNNSTLVPVSAVRNEGENLDFVYTVDYNYNFWGTQMKAVKQSVTVLERSDTIVSVQEDLRGTKLCDKEDRAIEDGKSVMEYVN